MVMYLTGKLTATSEDYKLLENMNKLTSLKYLEMKDIAVNISRNLKDLNQKHAAPQAHLDQITLIEEQVAGRLQVGCIFKETRSQVLEVREARKEFISTKTLTTRIRAEMRGMELIPTLQFLKGSGAADPRKIPALTSGWVCNFGHLLTFPKSVAPGTSSYHVLHCVPWTKAQKSGSTPSGADTGEALGSPSPPFFPVHLGSPPPPS
ncbi:uncharacterized protein LOC114036758 [Vombatus ursinus]|uniref:uncharacterized protein LOC114036758 n=1 Tax=Vombatus ursinus TaxID=29139 RepID=UPI000FFD2586|nr:uncharacterized protein LOC114036758 [Vombatus ursinus]